MLINCSWKSLTLASMKPQQYMWNARCQWAPYLRWSLGLNRARTVDRRHQLPLIGWTAISSSQSNSRMLGHARSFLFSALLICSPTLLFVKISKHILQNTNNYLISKFQNSFIRIMRHQMLIVASMMHHFPPFFQIEVISNLICLFVMICGRDFELSFWTPAEVRPWCNFILFPQNIVIRITLNKIVKTKTPRLSTNYKMVSKQMEFVKNLALTPRRMRVSMHDYSN